MENTNRSPTESIKETDVWDEQIDGSEVQQTSKIPQQETQQIGNPLLELARRKKAEAARVTQVLQPHPYSQYNGRPIPWIPVLVIGGTFGMVTLLGIVAIIASALPSSQVSRQQEMLSAVAMEASKARPSNNVCFFAVHCPDSGVKEQPKDQVIEPVIEEPKENFIPESPRTNNIALYDPVTNRYEEWFNWYATGTLEDVAQDANTLTDVDCAQDPDRCRAMNDVKRIMLRNAGA